MPTLPQNLRSLIRHASAALAAVLLAGPAAGMTFAYEWDPSEGTEDIALNSDVGDVERLLVSFDDVTEVLVFGSAFSPVGNNLLPDGGWLVLSDGPNPKGDVSEWAIYYLDRVTGNLTAYVYDGKNGPDSWKQSPFLQEFPGAVDASIGGDGNLTMGFSIDVSAINAAGIGPDWQGTRFSDGVGIWFHAAAGTEAVYGDDGSLVSWQTRRDGFFDGLEGFSTRQVPEPAASLFVGLVGVALLAAGRRASIRR
jgi:hypothetical protein